VLARCQNSPALKRVLLSTCPHAARRGAGRRLDAPKRNPPIIHKFSADARQLIINACASMINKPGPTFKKVATLLKVSVGVANSLWREHTERVAEARAKGVPEEEVKVPRSEPERRKRVSKVKEKHYDFVVRCLSKMVYDKDLGEIPSIRCVD